jgi:hypothetical protein
MPLLVLTAPSATKDGSLLDRRWCSGWLFLHSDRTFIVIRRVAAEGLQSNFKDGTSRRSRSQAGKLTYRNPYRRWRFPAATLAIMSSNGNYKKNPARARVTPKRL